MDARTKAVNYLNIKPRTKHQVEEYLKRKGTSNEEIVEIIAELEEYHYIDDTEYARMYFEYGFEKGRGIMRIKRELAEKGVASDVIEIAFEELDEIPDQFEAAFKIGETIVGGIDTDKLDYNEKRKLQAKIGRRLVSRGFSSEIAYKVINKLV